MHSIQEAWGTLSPPADAKTALAENSRELAGRVARADRPPSLLARSNIRPLLFTVVSRGSFGCKFRSEWGLQNRVDLELQSDSEATVR
jgi:hypothetical protein